MSAVWEEAVRCHREGNFAEADQLYHQVLHEAKQAEDEEAYEIAVYHLARVAFDAQDNPAAIRRFKQLLDMQEGNGDNRGISRTLRYLSELYLRQDELKRSIKLAEKAYDIVEGVWDREQMASSKHLLGILYQRKGDGLRAISALREAQAIWEEIPNEAALLQTTLVLADVYEDQAKLPIAVRALKQAIDLLSQDDDIEEIAEIHFRLAQMSSELGDFKNTLLHLLSCLGRHRVLQSPLLQRDIEAVQQLRVSISDAQFWPKVSTHLPEEGVQQLRLLLEEYFPSEVSAPEQIESVASSDSLVTQDDESYVEEKFPEQPPVSEHPSRSDLEIEVSEQESASQDNLEETEEDFSLEIPDGDHSEAPDEATSFGEELGSEEFSRTQELSKYQENKKEPPPVVVNWEEEDVDRTENSLFVEAQPAFMITDVTRSKIQLTEVEIKNNFYRHFFASFFGVLIALVLVQWILG